MLASSLQSSKLLNKRLVSAEWFHLDITLSYAQHTHDSQQKLNALAVQTNCSKHSA